MRSDVSGILSAASEISDSAFLLLAKLTGATVGSAISIVYVLPKNKREALIRFIVGLGIGVIFGSATGLVIADYLEVKDRLSPFEVTLSGSAAASLCAWWGLGILSRLARSQTKSV